MHLMKLASENSAPNTWIRFSLYKTKIQKCHCLSRHSHLCGIHLALKWYKMNLLGALVLGTFWWRSKSLSNQLFLRAVFILDVIFKIYSGFKRLVLIILFSVLIGLYLLKASGRFPSWPLWSEPPLYARCVTSNFYGFQLHLKAGEISYG